MITFIVFLKISLQNKVYNKNNVKTLIFILTISILSSVYIYLISYNLNN